MKLKRYKPFDVTGKVCLSDDVKELEKENKRLQKEYEELINDMKRLLLKKV